MYGDFFVNFRIMPRFRIAIFLKGNFMDWVWARILRISSAYLVKFNSEWYACDRHQKANLLGVLPFHTKISTKTVTAYKRNHLWPWNSLETLIMVPAFSECLFLVPPSPVFGWREKSTHNKSSKTNSSHQTLQAFWPPKTMCHKVVFVYIC